MLHSGLGFLLSLNLLHFFFILSLIQNKVDCRRSGIKKKKNQHTRKIQKNAFLKQAVTKAYFRFIQAKVVFVVVVVVVVCFVLTFHFLNYHRTCAICCLKKANHRKFALCFVPSFFFFFLLLSFFEALFNVLFAWTSFHFTSNVQHDWSQYIR